MCLYVRTYVPIRTCHMCTLVRMCTIRCALSLLLDDGGQQTALNGAGSGGLHSPKETSPDAPGCVALPSNGVGMRPSPPRTTQVETHGTPMTDPLPRAVTVDSCSTPRYVNGKVPSASPGPHESSVSPRNSNLPDVVIVNGGPPPEKQKTPSPPPQSTTAPPPVKEVSPGLLAPMYNGSLQPHSYGGGAQYDRGYTGVTVLPHAQPELRENLVIRRKR